jgi:hypothetical protein
MNIREFLEVSQFSTQKELRRVLLLAFYYLKQQELESFTLKEISEGLTKLGYAKPNQARLKTNLKKSKLFVAGKTKDSFRIHPISIETLENEYPGLAKKSEEIYTQNSVIDESLLLENRSFILSLMRQINASYENNIFDGCAVLMRRLLEILLILSYEELGIESNIRDADGNYKQLNSIIDDATGNSKLKLSRNSKECLEKFRKLGNFSAHKIYYNAKRSYIEPLILDYSAVIEELLYKASLRK